MESPLRKLRIAKGMTLSHLAEHFGISKGYLSKIEQGLCSPSPGLMRQIIDWSSGSLTFDDFFPPATPPGEPSDSSPDGAPAGACDIAPAGDEQPIMEAAQ